MRGHRTRRRNAPHVAFLALALGIAGCVPQELGAGDIDHVNHNSGGSKGGDTGGDGGDDGSGDDDPPPVDPRFTFAISASSEDPFVSVAEPIVGPYDLHLWLVCAEPGLFLVQSSLAIEGDALVGEGFTPDAGVIGIDWDLYGEFIASLSDCDAGPRRLGVFHLNGSGEGVAFNLQSAASLGRATPCGGSSAKPFACRGFASDGSEPSVVGAQHGCEDDASAIARAEIAAASTRSEGGAR